MSDDFTEPSVPEPTTVWAVGEKQAYRRVKDTARTLAEAQRAYEAAKAPYMEALAALNAIIAPVK